LQKFDAATLDSFKRRVTAELRTTFASHYTGQVSLAQALSPEHIAVYGKRATGEKYLVTPNSD
jgi:NADPH2:quinone reductase